MVRHHPRRELLLPTILCLPNALSSNSFSSHIAYHPYPLTLLDHIVSETAGGGGHHHQSVGFFTQAPPISFPFTFLRTLLQRQNLNSTVFKQLRTSLHKNTGRWVPLLFAQCGQEAPHPR